MPRPKSDVTGALEVENETVCGIAGTLHVRRGLAADAALAGRMADALAHRGPDDAGCLLDGPVALGHRRLSIIDLTSAGHQPMTRDGSSWLIFNGEIYNYLELRDELRELGHTFTSASDSEVLLAAHAQWGTDMLGRLNGMFAFAIWDRRAQELLLARDRFGVKPLYYTTSDGVFRFASEIKGLLADEAVPRRPNDRRILEFLAYGLADHTAETMFAEIAQLPAASFLVARPYEPVPAPERWYALRARGGGEEPAATRVRQRLERAVELRLRSDVPVGVALSGGMDSSSVLCVATALRTRENLPAPKSFSARSSDPKQDEYRFSADVIAATGSENATVLPEFNGLVDELDSLLWHMDEPFHSPSVYGQRKVDELARVGGVTVLLDGQGGDEVLSGYHHFHYPSLLLAFARRGDLRGLWREIDARRRRLGTSPLRSVKDVVRLLVARHRRRVGAPDWLAAGREPPPRPIPAADLRAHQDYGVWISPLPSYNHHADRNSMTYSLETRNPFLDVDFVESARSLGPGDLLHDGFTKWALRESVRDVVPATVVDRAEKQGFTTDEAVWLREAGLRDGFRRAFESASFASRGYFEPSKLLATLEEHARGERNRAPELWRAYVVERWFRLFIDPAQLEAPPPPATAIPSAGAALAKLQVLDADPTSRELTEACA